MNIIKNLKSSVENTIIIAKGDSGATNHYWRPEDVNCLKNLHDVEGPTVVLPDNTAIKANQEGTLPIKNSLSSCAQKVTILPHLKSSSLISLGQLCDDNCQILLTKKNLFAMKNEKLILQGYRNYSDGLWDIPVHNLKPLKANVIYPTPRSIYKNDIILQPITKRKYWYTNKDKKRTEKQEPFKNIFRSFDDIIDLFEYDLAIKNKVKTIV